ncbi:MAG: amidohydrolase [Anaerolineae bacterium]|nr:amidohydrolase [Anaerolineae bacterium]
MLDRARAMQEELIRLRRDIHAYPELGFQEVRTAALVADTLQEIGGITIRTGVGKTGVIGEIGSGDGPVIAIRADMDALPIQEKTGLVYASQNDGVMHACGHDAHTAMLLGAAHLLKQSMAEEEWRGRVRFLFQPSEEAFGANGISGATAMIDDGAMEGVDRVIALHVISNVPSGELHFSDGPSLANVDSFRAWIQGDGGHGAAPHEGSDPLHMLASILPDIYAIPSRRINPLHPCVVSLGMIQAGSATNVIPGEVHLAGTIRSFDQPTREKLWFEVENALRLSEMMGGSYRFELTRGYPAMINDKQVNDWMRQVAHDFGYNAAIKDEPFGMGAEDFAYMTQKAPGAMFFLGAEIPDGMMRNHHTDIFDIDESVMPLGAAILAETARRFVTGQLDE